MGLFGRKRRGERVRGTGRVVSCSGAPHNAAYGTLHMNVVVEAPGLPAYSHEYRKIAVRVTKWPSPGQVLPVEVDPTDPRDVDVLWDDLPTIDEAAKLQAERMAAMLRGEPGGQPVPDGMAGMVDQLQQMFPGAVVSTGSSAAPPPGGMPPVRVMASQTGGDPVERLAKLAQLRDAGIVDQAQFEQLKAQILAQADIDPD
jgi:hypothetical protein